MSRVTRKAIELVDDLIAAATDCDKEEALINYEKELRDCRASIFAYIADLERRAGVSGE